MKDIITGLENYIQLLIKKRPNNKNLTKEIKFQKQRLKKLRKKILKFIVLILLIFRRIWSLHTIQLKQD